MKKKYPGEKSKLFFTDTDSLTYVIKTEDIYDDMFSNKDFFDFSEYDKDSKYFNTENMKKIEKVKDEMKDEMKGIAKAEFIGLRAKMYSILTRKGKEVKKTKGVSKSVVKHAISHANCINCLVNEKIYLHRMKAIQSIKHKVYTIEQNKKSLVPYDDKRFLLNDGINTLPYGHYRI